MVDPRDQHAAELTRCKLVMDRPAALAAKQRRKASDPTIVSRLRAQGRTRDKAGVLIW